MAVGQGYSKVVTSGSVFHYDTGDVVNSFKGKPISNQLLAVGYTYGTQNQPYFKSSYGTEYDIIPGLGGQVLVDYCNFFNDYNGGSGNCCPSVFYFGNFSVSPSTVYTYQIVYKTPDGYANANYMYHYEFGPGGYVTEYGLWSDTRIQDLGNGWTHAWGTFTSNAATNYFQTYLFHYQYTQTKIQIAGVMLTQGDTVIPPRQFIPVNTTRTATQSLLDLTGNYSIDASNLSFNSNGQITFDGTNDCIIIPTSNFNKVDGQELTVEVIMKPGRNSGQYQDIVVNRSDGQYNWMLYQHASDGSIQLHGSGQYKSSYVPTIGQNIHVVATVTSGQVSTLYVNGVVQQTVTGFIYAPGNPSLLCIGVFGTSKYEPYLGNIDVVKIYNRALTPGEITQNYNHYKTRFNLP